MHDGCDGLYNVLTTPSEKHPWAKYYASRGLSRPPIAELAQRVVRTDRASVKAAAASKQAEVSAELAAAVAAVTAMPAGTAAPFVTAVQKEAVVREVKRRGRARGMRFAGLVAVVLVGLHLLVTRVINRTPSFAAAQVHAAQLKADLLPLYSTVRQPMQVDSVTVSPGEEIGGDRVRYVAHVTLRLRKRLYQPAVTNGTMAYRQLQISLQAARDQDLRYRLFETNEEHGDLSLPLLIHVAHRAGESVVVKVPFVARRFGWTWKFDAPQTALRVANRTLDGDSIEYYAGAPYLIFGEPQTLAEIRRRSKDARNYVLAVAKEVQRHSGGQAVEELVPDIALAEALPADASIEDRPAVDPDAPAIELPTIATMPAQTLVLESAPRRRG